MAESTSQNTSLTGNDSSSNSSTSQMQSNVSFSLSPAPFVPPLPPLPTSQVKFSPPPVSQQPPPLPPLPPALASKYAINKALYLECVEPFSSVNNPATSNQAATKPMPISCDTSSLDSDFGGSSYTSETYKGKDQIDSTDYRSERQIKCTSTCSDIDVFIKDYNSAPLIDTPSEVASMSGGDLSGEIFASPTQASNTSMEASNYNNDLPTATDSIEVNFQQLNSSLLMSTTPLQTETINSTITPAIELNETSDQLLIDTSKTTIERSASFIDNRYATTEKQRLSRSSTLTTANSECNPTSRNHSTYTEQSGNFELVFKETSNCLIKRLFGCLGNVNAIKDPLIHKRVFEFIYNKWEKLNKIKDTLKLTDLSQVIPSITYFSPWLFEAIYQLPASFQSGKLIAYKTLCKIVIRSASNGGMWNMANEFDLVSDEFINLFYMTLHQGLNLEDKVFYFGICLCGEKKNTRLQMKLTL